MLLEWFEVSQEGRRAALQGHGSACVAGRTPQEFRLLVQSRWLFAHRELILSIYWQHFDSCFSACALHVSVGETFQKILSEICGKKGLIRKWLLISPFSWTSKWSCSSVYTSIALPDRRQLMKKFFAENISLLLKLSCLFLYKAVHLLLQFHLSGLPAELLCWVQNATAPPGRLIFCIQVKVFWHDFTRVL